MAAAERHPAGFAVRTVDGVSLLARTLLLATGRDDELPDRPGFRALYGRGVYHCPFCDAWEHRDRPFVAYGRGGYVFDLACELLTWTRRITVCTDGPGGIEAASRRQLAANRITVDDRPVRELRADASGALERVCFASGESLPCGALFFVSPVPQKSHLPAALGCAFDPTGGVKCTAHAATGVPGLFVAGNVRCGIHLAITAAAEGAEAAIAINDLLVARDLACGRRAPRRRSRQSSGHGWPRPARGGDAGSSLPLDPARKTRRL